MDNLREWIVEEQVSLWYDFKHAVDFSNNGYWSMQSADFASRIVASARLVGASSWRQVPTSLIYSGLMEALYQIAGVEYAAPTSEQLAETTALIISTGGFLPKTAELERYAMTISRMRAEAAEIRGEGV